MLDNAKSLRNIDDVLCDRRAAFAQAPGREIDHSRYVTLTRLDELRRKQARMGRSIVGRFTKYAALLDRKFDDQRQERAVLIVEYHHSRVHAVCSQNSNLYRQPPRGS